jgi:hypothetical protein
MARESIVARWAKRHGIVAFCCCFFFLCCCFHSFMDSCMRDFIYFLSFFSFYQAAMDWRTVGVTNYFENGPHPIHPGAAVKSYLAKGGINRVIVGHKPFGDSPVVMREHGLDVLTCDTAFSDPVSFLPFSSINFKSVCTRQAR